MTSSISKSYRAQSKEAGQLCSVCQTQLVRGEQVTCCSECNIVYHSECWNENEGCAQYGCKNAPEIEKDESIEPQSNVWGEEKSCPQCQKQIKAIALVCRYCGATFDTRDFVSQDEFANREYQDREYIQARNAMVALFLVSITGCLSPIALILHLVLRYGGRLGGKLVFERMPEELKALNLFGLIISATLVCVGVLMAIV